MVSVLALVAKGILAVTGKTADLGNWAGFVDEGINLLVGGLTIWGVVVGSIHVSRGPALTPSDQAATIVAAIQGPPASAAVAQVESAVAQVEQIKAAEAHRF
jgi:hypothetical protein